MEDFLRELPRALRGWLEPLLCVDCTDVVDNVELGTSAISYQNNKRSLSKSSFPLSLRCTLLRESLSKLTVVVYMHACIYIHMYVLLLQYSHCFKIATWHDQLGGWSR